MTKLIVDNFLAIISGILTIAFGGYVTWQIYKKNRFVQAMVLFRNKLLTELIGLYPIPSNWPTDINSHLRGIFPKLQATITEFRPFVPWYRRRAFDKAWFRYRCSTDREEDKQCQCYHHYKPGISTSTVNGKEVTIDTTETYKETFKHNVDALLKFAKKT